MMLVINLGKTKLGLAFEHPHIMIEGAKGPQRKPIATKCQIFGIRDGGEPMLLAKGKAECSPLDNFNKAKGRKLALTRALNKLTTLTKGERTMVWNQYLATRKSIQAKALVAETTVGTGVVS